jgi:hypothetical protein
MSLAYRFILPLMENSDSKLTSKEIDLGKEERCSYIHPPMLTIWMPNHKAGLVQNHY